MKTHSSCQFGLIEKKKEGGSVWKTREKHFPQHGQIQKQWKGLHLVFAINQICNPINHTNSTPKSNQKRKKTHTGKEFIR